VVNRGVVLSDRLVSIHKSRRNHVTVQRRSINRGKAQKGQWKGRCSACDAAPSVLFQQPFQRKPAAVQPWVEDAQTDLSSYSTIR